VPKTSAMASIRIINNIHNTNVAIETTLYNLKILFTDIKYGVKASDRSHTKEKGTIVNWN
jgi:hypothetical protein